MHVPIKQSILAGEAMYQRASERFVLEADGRRRNNEQDGSECLQNCSTCGGFSCSAVGSSDDPVTGPWVAKVTGVCGEAGLCGLVQHEPL